MIPFESVLRKGYAKVDMNTTILVFLGVILLLLMGTVALEAMLLSEQREIRRRITQVETNTKDFRARQSKITHDAPLVHPEIERPKQIGPRHRELRGAKQGRGVKRSWRGGDTDES